jgi:hypothetical protein
MVLSYLPQAMRFAHSYHYLTYFNFNASTQVFYCIMAIKIVKNYKQYLAVAMFIEHNIA